VRKALTSLPWGRQVQVDFNRQQATVTVVADQYDQKALLKALEKEGYQGKVVMESGQS
jgi:copper chaperone CopZ